MQELWNRIEAWFAANLPEEFQPLPGGTPGQMQAVETSLGLRLPDDVREFYSVHAGIAEHCALYENQSLVSLEDIPGHWRLMCGLEEYFQHRISNPRGPIKPVWGNRKWIPITDSAGGTIMCIDMDPAPGGTEGQVIEHIHEEGPLWVLAPSLREFLKMFAEDLEAGKYAQDEGYNLARIEGYWPGTEPL